MTALGHPLAAHHVDKRLIPLGHLPALGLVEIETADYVGGDPVDVAVIGPDHILYLPHI